MAQLWLDGLYSLAALSMVPGGWSVICADWRSFVLIVGVLCLLCSMAVPGVWGFFGVTRSCRGKFARGSTCMTQLYAPNRRRPRTDRTNFITRVFVVDWLFVFPLCGFSLSLFCNYFITRTNLITLTRCPFGLVLGL